MSFGVASPVDLGRAMLTTRLPHQRRHGEPNGFNLVQLLREWLKRRQERRELRQLDDTLLRDAGLDPVLVREEVKRPFYVPIHLDRRRD